MSAPFVRPFLSAVIGLSAAAAVVNAQEEKKEAPAPSAPATSQPSQPVDYRKLKDLLPAELAGIKRTDATGEKTTFGELKLSTAKGQYDKDVPDGESQNVNVEITDYGATKGIADGLAYWAQVELDQEGDAGYEKSRKIEGHPALEKYTNDGKSGSLQIFVANRFVVNVTTSNVDVERFKKIGDSLKIKELAALK